MTLAQIRKKFTTKGIKVGDYVITAEIHKVIRKFGTIRGEFEVGGTAPKWSTLKDPKHGRIMRVGWGQQGIMKLR